MQLKPEALNALKLPVRVKAGFLGSVKLKVCCVFFLSILSNLKNIYLSVLVIFSFVYRICSRIVFHLLSWSLSVILLNFIHYLLSLGLIHFILEVEVLIFLGLDPFNNSPLIDFHTQLDPFIDTF